MAVNQNWTRYEVDIGWREVQPSEVFQDSIILKLLDETIDKDYLLNILNPTYSQGKFEL